MRKTLLSAACAAALCSEAGFAVAANVSVYGAIDEFFAVNNDSGTVSSALSSGGSTGSYLGLKGEEEIGLFGGSKAVFKMESGFLGDDGTYAQSFAGNTSRIFHREVWMGLQNPHFGQISFGRQYTPHFLTWAMSDVNGLSLGTASSPFFFPGGGATMGGSDPTQDDLVRHNNSIFWASPNFNGLTLMGYMAFGEASKNSSSNGNIYNVAVQYAKTPLFVMASALYQNLGTSANGFRPRGNDQYYELAVSYDFGFTKPALQFEWKNGEDEIWSQDFWLVQIGTTTPLFGGRLNTTATYYNNRTLEKSDGYSFGARFDYDLSKRTMIYIGVEALVQEDNAQFAIEAGPDSSLHFTTSAPGNDQQQLFLGIRHRF